MDKKRLLCIGLDAFDPDFAAAMVAAGRMPNLSRIAGQSLRFSLTSGIEKFTGLAWEQFSSDQLPADSDRYSAVTFEPAHYHPDQPRTKLRPFTEKLGCRTIVFDMPYFDLANAEHAQGIVAWGAHDPGVATFSKPPGLLEELAARFGPYPSADHIYGFVWPSADATKTMADLLRQSVRRRGEAAEWLLGERLPDWDLALIVIPEYHSATEPMWHGVDASHPLHSLPSAAPAREGIEGVYEEADRMLGRLADRFDDAAILLFNPHGMGRNNADAMAMSLVPELLYRHFTGRRGLAPDPSWRADGCGADGAGIEKDWGAEILQRTHVTASPKRLWGPRPIPVRPSDIDWMPAAWYRVAWPEMPAFALPAFYDARIRVNLKRREARGRVPLKRYRRVLDDVASLLGECRDASTGRQIEFDVTIRQDDPYRIAETDADMYIRFGTDHYGLVHPRLGQIGPVPCRRTGGHTGGDGTGYLFGFGPAGELGRFRAFEVSALVRHLVGDASAGGDLVDAVRARGESDKTKALAS